MENNEVITENTVISKTKEDEISLIDLIAVLWKRKWLIIIMTGAGAILSVLISILSLVLPPDKSFMPNKYKPYAQMLITEDSSSGTSSMLGSLGGLAGMAGISLGGGATNSALAGYLVNSNTIQDNIIEHFNFIQEWEIEKYPKASSRETLKEKLKSTFDDETGIFTISFEDKNPVLARDVVNYTVNLLDQRFNELGVDKNKLQKQNLEDNINNTYAEIINLQKQIRDIELSVTNVYSPNSTPSIMMDTSLVKMELAVQEEIYKQLKSQYEMLKVTMASEKPVFQILEYAEVPDRKSGPSRGKLCIVITFASGFLSVFLAFLLNALQNIKKDSATLAKFKKENK